LLDYGSIKEVALQPMMNNHKGFRSLPCIPMNL